MSLLLLCDLIAIPHICRENRPYESTANAKNPSKQKLQVKLGQIVTISCPYLVCKFARSDKSDFGHA
jgi:hypothetical protein